MKLKEFLERNEEECNKYCIVCGCIKYSARKERVIMCECDYKKLSKEVKRLQKTRTPRCQTCKKNYVKITDYEWKPNCNCMTKNMRLFLG